MFSPRYQFTSALLDNVIRIKNIISDLNSQTFSDLVLAQFEKDSYAISAYASTSIEGNPLPLTEVRKLLKAKPEHVRDSEKEVLNYNEALKYLDHVVNKKEAISSKFICEVQKTVITGLIDKKNQGKFRTEPVVVNDPKLRQIVYIPPDAKDVPGLMDEMIGFLNREINTIDPIILAGILHKQFVIIHPFIDGNGRTTRLITKYFLAMMGLNTFRLFSFENYYNNNVTRYFEKVGLKGDYYDISSSIDFTEWLIYFTDGIIDELLRVGKQLKNTKKPRRISEYEKVILDYISKNGSISDSEYSKITDRARSTRILDFKRMVEKGLIERHEKSKSTYYTLK